MVAKRPESATANLVSELTTTVEDEFDDLREQNRVLAKQQKVLKLLIILVGLIQVALTTAIALI